MKKIIYLVAICFVQGAFAQVGINTENPQGIFNVDGARDNATTGTPTTAQQVNDFLVMPDGKTGIGTAPGTSLDVNGAITNRETSVTIASNAATLPANTSMVRLTGTATGAITVTAAAAPNAGQRMIVYNTTSGGFTATFNGLPIANGQALEFIYSNGGWRSTDNGAGSVGGLNDWHLTGNSGTSATINFIGTTNNVDFVTRTNNTERIRVTGTGNVGIGTTVPVSRLSVVSDGAGSGVADDMEIASYNAAGPGIGLFFKSALGTQAAPVNLSNGSSLGIISWNGQSNGGMQGLSSIAAGYRGNGTTNLSDLAISTSSTERMRVTETGNIGIGTTAPGTRLDVNGAITNRETSIAVASNMATVPANISQVQLTGTATGVIAITAAVAPNAGQRLIIYNNTTGGFNAILNGFSITNGQAVEFIYSNGAWRTTDNGASSVGGPNEWHITGNAGINATTNFIGTTNNVDFVTRTNNTERMRVTGTGNVGIGTNAPTASLEIYSTANNTSGLKFSRINSSTPTGTGQAIGVDSNGNVITVSTAATITSIEASTNGDGGTYEGSFNVNGSGWILVPNTSTNMVVPAGGKAIFINCMLGIDYLGIPAGSGSSYYTAKLFIDGVETNVFQTTQETSAGGQTQFSLSSVKFLTAGNHTIEVRMRRTFDNGMVAATNMLCGVMSMSFNASYIN